MGRSAKWPRRIPEPIPTLVRITQVNLQSLTRFHLMNGGAREHHDRAVEQIGRIARQAQQVNHRSRRTSVRRLAAPAVR